MASCQSLVDVADIEIGGSNYHEKYKQFYKLDPGQSQDKTILVNYN